VFCLQAAILQFAVDYINVLNEQKAALAARNAGLMALLGTASTMPPSPPPAKRRRTPANCTPNVGSSLSSDEGVAELGGSVPAGGYCAPCGHVGGELDHYHQGVESVVVRCPAEMGVKSSIKDPVSQQVRTHCLVTAQLSNGWTLFVS
jgi:hypothetical protein